MEELTEEEKKQVYERLAEIRKSPELLEKFNSPEWIMREVVASSYLSDIDVSVLDFEGKEDYVFDGFGSCRSVVCSSCGQRTVQVVRPGKFQCSKCG